MKPFKIRQISLTEIPLLKEFLYEAIYQRDSEKLLPREVINEPKLKIYIDDFGKQGDCCLVADVEGVVVGAVWARVLAGEIKGYGNVDEQTPELAISLYKEYRNMGMGTALLQSMLKFLQVQGYKKISLSVQKDNYAAGMYKNVGFAIVKELKEDYLMVCELDGEASKEETRKLSVFLKKGLQKDRDKEVLK